MNSINEAWYEAIRRIVFDGGERVEVRGHLTWELLGDLIVFPMTRPILTFKERALSYDFLFAEAWWILSGNNRLDVLTPFAPSYGDYSDDGLRLSGAYGPKIVDQITYVVDCLLEDVHSRQAVINIWRENPRKSKDVPCTLSVQFMVRDEALHTFVTMRSSDIWLGLPYDAFTITMLAYMIGVDLNRAGVKCVLGDMHHCAASRHLYEKNAKRATEMLTAKAKPEQERPVYLETWNQFANSLQFLDVLRARVQTPDKLREHPIAKKMPWLTI